MWLALTTDQVLNSLAASEQQALSTSSNAADLNFIIQTVTYMVIGKVNTYGPNQGNLGPPGTMPSEALGAACAIARFRLLTSIPGTQLITKWREQEKDEAYTLLDEIAAGKLQVIGGDGTISQRKATYGGEDLFPVYLDGNGWPYPYNVMNPGTRANPVWEGGYW
jgi:hypothetical protein